LHTSSNRLMDPRDVMTSRRDINQPANAKKLCLASGECQ
jgi:hypothetical protein